MCWHLCMTEVHSLVHRAIPGELRQNGVAGFAVQGFCRHVVDRRRGVGAQRLEGDKVSEVGWGRRSSSGRNVSYSLTVSLYKVPDSVPAPQRWAQFPMLDGLRGCRCRESLVPVEIEPAGCCLLDACLRPSARFGWWTCRSRKVNYGTDVMPRRNTTIFYTSIGLF